MPALTRLKSDVAHYLAQRILVRQRGDMEQRETWADVAEGFDIITICSHDLGGCPGRWVPAPDSESGVIYCNLAQSMPKQALVVAHELAHGLMSVLQRTLLDKFESRLSRLAIQSDGTSAPQQDDCDGWQVRHDIACRVALLCIPNALLLPQVLYKR